MVWGGGASSLGSEPAAAPDNPKVHLDPECNSLPCNPAENFIHPFSPMCVHAAQIARSWG
jgi:hypothetical protein